MIPLHSRRIRFLFRTAGIDRPFCWFEQKGDELYWGPSQGAMIDGVTTNFHERDMTITVPDEIKRLEGESFEASFHASGQFHLKRGEKLFGARDQWRDKKAISAPYRVAVLMTRHPEQYKPYPSGRSLTRRQTHAQVIEVHQGQEATRHYLEFFVSPEGRFPLPPPMLLSSAGDNTEPQPMCFSLNHQLILVTRHFVLAPQAGFSGWHPDLDIWIYGDDQTNDVLRRKK